MSEVYESKAKNPSKKEWAEQLLRKVEQALDSGKTPEQALETLTIRQYDFLVEYGVDIDEYVLTAEQRKNIAELMQKGAGRPTFPNGYDKKYPKAKRDFYELLVEFIEAQGGEIEPREKVNYRDIDFVHDGNKYRIVFSSPKK